MKLITLNYLRRSKLAILALAWVAFYPTVVFSHPCLDVKGMTTFEQAREAIYAVVVAQKSEKPYSETKSIYKAAELAVQEIVSLYKDCPHPEIAYAVSYYYTRVEHYIGAEQYANYALQNEQYLSEGKRRSISLIRKWVAIRHEQERPRPTSSSSSGGSVKVQGGSAPEFPPKAENLEWFES